MLKLVLEEFDLSLKENKQEIVEGKTTPVQQKGEENDKDEVAGRKRSELQYDDDDDSALHSPK